MKIYIKARAFFFVIFLLFIPFQAFCSKVDSLKIVSSLDSAITLLDAFNFNDAKKKLNSASNEAKKINNKTLIGLCLYVQGNILQRQNLNFQSINYYSKALQIFDSLKSKKYIALTNGAIGLSYSQQGQYSEALNYYYKSLSLYDELNDMNKKATTLANISVIFWSLEKFDTALSYLNRSNDILIAHHDKTNLAYNYGNQALIYNSINQINKAKNTYLKTIELCAELGDKSCLANAYSNLGLIYNDKGEWKIALDYQYKALELRKEIGDNIGLANTNNNIAQIFLQYNKIDSAFYFSQKGYEYGLKTRTYQDIKESALLISTIFERKKQYDKALAFFKIFSNAKDSVLNSQSSESLARTILNYEFEKKQQNLILSGKIAQNQISKGKAYLYLVLTLFAAAIIILFVTLKFYLTKSKINKDLVLKNQKLVEINREKEAIYKIVVHDLKTPIGQIKGLINIIEIGNNLNDGQKEVFSNINRAILYGSNLIDNLLKANMYEDDLKPVSFSQINIEQLLNDIIEGNMITATNKKIEINKNISFWGLLKTNKEFLSEIVENLLSNAIKFSQSNTTIFIDCYEEDAIVKIKIKDEGQGFINEDYPFIFSKYQQLSARPTSGENSTGLGLYIAKFLSDKIGASLTLESEFKKGSTFTISIPKNA